MARKTVDIEDLKAKINDQLLHSFDHDTSGRSALAALISTVLHDANQYKGFNYLTPAMMSASLNGTTVGIRPNQLDPEEVRQHGWHSNLLLLGVDSYHRYAML